VSSSSAFDIKVSPNPSATSFRLVVVSDNDKEINIRVVDISGRLISVIRKVRRNETVTIGNDFISGTYFVEVVQGINRKLVKLVKVK
jgi:hypothetical protein